MQKELPLWIMGILTKEKVIVHGLHVLRFKVLPYVVLGVFVGNRNYALWV